MRYWLSPRNFIAIALALTVVAPFYLVSIPPLNDLYGHIGRYHIINQWIDGVKNQYYHIELIYLGNLGIDIVVAVLSKIFDIYLATKISIMIIIIVTFFACLQILTRTGRVSWETMLLVTPFFYSTYFLMGFVNFYLSVGLALLGWVAWETFRDKSSVATGILFGAIGIVTYIAHAGGILLLITMIAGTETERLLEFYDTRAFDRKLIFIRVGYFALMAFPILVSIFFTSKIAFEYGSLFKFLTSKIVYLAAVLRYNNMILDLALPVITISIIAYSYTSGRISIDRPLLGALIATALLFVALPGEGMGGENLDSRYASVIWLLFICTFRIEAGINAQEVFSPLLFTTAFLAALRLIYITDLWVYFDRQNAQSLTALSKVEEGSRIRALSVYGCRQWNLDAPTGHLQSLAIVERNAFVSNQWESAVHVLVIDYDLPDRFRHDPFQFVSIKSCPQQFQTFEHVFRDFPRDKFDYVWITRADLERSWKEFTREFPILYEDDTTVLLKVQH